MQNLEIHEVVRNTTNGIFVCRACTFYGNLSQAVEHAVKNQFVVTDKLTSAQHEEKWDKNY